MAIHRAPRHQRQSQRRAQEAAEAEVQLAVEGCAFIAGSKHFAPLCRWVCVPYALLGRRPKFWDSERSRWHDFCGKGCATAHKAAAASMGGGAGGAAPGGGLPSGMPASAPGLSSVPVMPPGQGGFGAAPSGLPPGGFGQQPAVPSFPGQPPPPAYQGSPYDATGLPAYPGAMPAFPDQQGYPPVHAQGGFPADPYAALPAMPGDMPAFPGGHPAAPGGGPPGMPDMPIGLPDLPPDHSALPVCFLSLLSLIVSFASALIFVCRDSLQALPTCPFSPSARCQVRMLICCCPDER